MFKNMAKKIKLMAEYNYFPLWYLETGDNLDEEDLPLSVEMIEKLNNWADIYNNIIDWDNPSESGFKSEEEKQNFDNQRDILVMELQKELGKDYQVCLFRENLDEEQPITDKCFNKGKKPSIKELQKKLSSRHRNNPIKKKKPSIKKIMRKGSRSLKKKK